MSKIKFFLPLLVLAACEAPATFDQPQPADTRDQERFPRRLQGAYLADDSTELLIDATTVLKKIDLELPLGPADIDSTLTILGDSIRVEDSGETFAFRRIGDTLMVHVLHTDTLFCIGEGQVLRKYRGHYFLNDLLDDGVWTVRKLTLKKGVLTLGTIADPADIRLMEEIAELPADTVRPRHFQVNRRQFREFVREGGFVQRDSFMRRG